MTVVKQLEDKNLKSAQPRSGGRLLTSRVGGFSLPSHNLSSWGWGPGHLFPDFRFFLTHLASSAQLNRKGNSWGNRESLGGKVLKKEWGDSIRGAGKPPCHTPPLLKNASLTRPFLTYVSLSLRHHLELSLLEDPWKSMESADLG